MSNWPTLSTTWPIIWAVKRNDGEPGLVICRAKDREGAKRIAAKRLLGNPDQFIVEPLSREGEAVVFDLEIEGKKNDTRLRGFRG
jgi:hypothetical protein